MAPDDRKIVLETVNRGFGSAEGAVSRETRTSRCIVLIEVWCDGRDPETASGGAGVVIPGDAGSGRWLMQAHTPTFGSGPTWTGVLREPGTQCLLWRWELWQPPRYQTEYGGGAAIGVSESFSDLKRLKPASHG